MTATSALRVAVTGGGTGGHTYPALTVVTALRERLATTGRDVELTWYGNPAGLEARIAADHGIRFHPIATGKIRRSLHPSAVARTAADLARVPYGILHATAHLARWRPHVVLSTGGYVAVPVGLAAAVTRRPLVMHEQTTSLGLANRLLARTATAIALSYDASLGLCHDGPAPAPTSPATRCGPRCCTATAPKPAPPTASTPPCRWST